MAQIDTLQWVLATDKYLQTVEQFHPLQGLYTHVVNIQELQCPAHRRASHHVAVPHTETDALYRPPTWLDVTLFNQIGTEHLIGYPRHLHGAAALQLRLHRGAAAAEQH